MSDELRPTSREEEIENNGAAEPVAQDATEQDIAAQDTEERAATEDVTTQDAAEPVAQDAAQQDTAEPVAQDAAQQDVAEQDTAAQAESAEAVTEEAAPQPAAERPAPTMSLRERTDFDDDIDDDDDEDDDEYEDDEDDDIYVEGPANYIQREKGGRARRIGSDIRVNDIDYKNIPMLSRFLDRRGRILSRRKTRVSAKVQRRIVTAIKRARHMALLPYIAEHTRIVQKRGR